MSENVELRVESVRNIFDDGNHNAFTDLCRFRDDLYLTFRSCPDGHGIFDTSCIVVLRSPDGGEWEEVFRFDVPLRDTRDPHFLVFQDRLIVYTGTWLVATSDGSRDLNDHLGYAAWSEDGANWRGPQWLEGTYGHYIWRAAAHGDKAYLCGRRTREFVPQHMAADASKQRESALLESEDGLVWRTVGLFEDEYGDETAFLFEEDGSILAVARTHGGRPAQVCRSKPRYKEWTRTALDRYIGGPMLAKWGDRYLVGGRKAIDKGNPRTTLYWLVNDQLQEITELPSGGDNSYPGFVELDDTRGLLSYYSSHEGSGGKEAPASIYLAGLSLTG